MSKINFFWVIKMNKTNLIFICGILIIFFITPTLAMQVTIETIDSDNYIVLNSNEPISISSFGIQLNYGPDELIYGIKSIDPFLTVANINNEENYTRIAASSGYILPYSTKHVLAGIDASIDFSPEIIVLDLYDSSLKPIITQNNNDKMGEFAPDLEGRGYQTPANPITPIPTEVRVSWVPPEQTIISGPIPIVTPKPEMIKANNKSELLFKNGESHQNDPQIPMNHPDSMLNDQYFDDSNSGDKANKTYASNTVLPLIIAILTTSLISIKRRRK